jgi:hypothetical protein
MEGISCEVKWNFYIPIDFTIPFILFTSHGIHSHPPPPPKKTPQDIVQGILDVLKRINDPNITLSK